MNVKYIGLSEINGPLVALDHVSGISYDEMAEIKLDDGTRRLARVVEVEKTELFCRFSREQKDFPLLIPPQAFRASLWSLHCLPKCWAGYSAEQASLSTDWEISSPKSTVI